MTSQYLNNRVRDQVVAESEKAIHELKLSGEMGVALYKSLINLHYFLEDKYRKSLDRESSKDDLNFEQAQERVWNALQSFNQSLLTADSVINHSAGSGKERSESRKVSSEILEELKSKFRIYASLIDQQIPLAEQNYDDGKEFFNVTIEPYFRTNVLPLVEQLREETQGNLDNEINRLNAELNYIGTILTLATIGAFVLSLVLAYFLYYSIATPLNVLSVAAKHIGAGNLDERIEVKTEDEIGQLGLEFNKMAENLSKTTVSKNFMDDIIESMVEALIVTDENSRIQKVNSATVDMLGYSESEILGKPLPLIFAGDERQDIVRMNGDAKFKTHETSYRTKRGAVIPVSLSRALIHDGENNVKGLVCVASDITQRKIAEKKISKSLKEKEILLAEIHHRVKNNLAVISGLLQMQIWETEDKLAETALKDSQLRVQSIALVHEKLYQSERLSFIEFDKYIGDLLEAINTTYTDTTTSVTIETDLERVPLNINQAIPCSLLLNELVVNAFKHAFKHDSAGSILVKLWMEDEDNMVFLKVRGSGPGLCGDEEDTEASTWGLSLIDTLTLQLNGDIKTYNDEGAVAEISFVREEVV